MSERKELNEDVLEQVAGGALGLDFNTNILYSGKDGNFVQHNCLQSPEDVKTAILYAHDTLGLRGDDAILNYLKTNNFIA